MRATRAVGVGGWITSGVLVFAWLGTGITTALRAMPFAWKLVAVLVVWFASTVWVIMEDEAPRGQ